MDITERFSLLDRQNGPTDDTGFATAVREGLLGKPKSLPCRFFYDAVGSDLFEQICELPEYYLTRAEQEILDHYASEIVAGLPANVTLVELGSGSATKTRLLIEALLADRSRLRFTPIDISRSALEGSSSGLLDQYSNLEITAVVAEYRAGIEVLKEENSGPELILWLGSSIGNLSREEARDFLDGIRSQMTEDDRLLIGVDLRKSANILEPAYDDAAGITSQFNENVLVRINAELGGHFDLDTFRHKAKYDDAIGRVEMHLVSEVDQRVSIDALGVEVHFTAGESIHTENSYKYSCDEIDALAQSSGLKIEGQWFDRDRRFSLNLMSASA
jgi:L-histidine Nalpha-methyltransferase